MADRFTDTLRSVADPLWETQYRHPFVRGIADGTISRARFERWARQDYVFLIDYCRVLALGAARADDLDTLTAFADLLSATVETEMRLHRGVAAELGIGGPELAATVAEPSVRAYADFLLRTATLGDLAELAGALLPCMWGFSDLGTRLRSEGPLPSDPFCRHWIESYADAAFARQAQWCRDLVDRLAPSGDQRRRDRVQAAFLMSCDHELAFWEMAWGR